MKIFSRLFQIYSDFDVFLQSDCQIIYFSCEFLHRVAGDVERKYHPRYYKTALCVHPTDARGLCSKNGAHCAFAHSTQDLRQPLHDALESYDGSLLDSENRDKTSFVIEDPIWNGEISFH